MKGVLRCFELAAGKATVLIFLIVDSSVSTRWSIGRPRIFGFGYLSIVYSWICSVPVCAVRCALRKRGAVVAPDSPISAHGTGEGAWLCGVFGRPCGVDGR